MKAIFIMPDKPYTPRIQELAGKWANGIATDAEKQELIYWYNQFDDEELILKAQNATTPGALKAEIYDAVQQRIQDEKKRIYLPWRRTAAAAAILILIASGSYFYFTNKPAKHSSPMAVTSLPANDVLPGGNKALLTLDNDSTVILDDAGNGIVAREGNAEAKKLNDGQLAYSSLPEKEAVVYHTLSTPRGGQYKVRLPDGTKVWLNAASSIRFPTAFTKASRRVIVTGEAYLEVAKDATRPFIVQVNEAEIEVLGTHFNIMAYENENTLQTTLLEGGVRFRSNGQSVVLKPGQQSRLGINGIKMIDKVDTTLAIAWKKGLIAFKSADIKTVMRQVERWYDVDVNYEGSVPQRTFSGEIPRNVNLSELLKLFEINKIKFRIDGTHKKLTIQH